MEKKKRKKKSTLKKDTSILVDPSLCKLRSIYVINLELTPAYLSLWYEMQSDVAKLRVRVHISGFNI